MLHKNRISAPSRDPTENSSSSEMLPENPAKIRRFLAPKISGSKNMDETPKTPVIDVHSNSGLRSKDEAQTVTMGCSRPLGSWLDMGFISTKIVGISYYKGATQLNEPGISLVCVREVAVLIFHAHMKSLFQPKNPVDRNAIAVHSVKGVKIGHIPAAVVSVCRNQQKND